jgi:predicted DNA-binding protein
MTKLSNDKSKDERLSVRLSPEEKAAYEKLCKILGKTPSDAVREHVKETIEGKKETPTYEELLKRVLDLKQERDDLEKYVVFSFQREFLRVFKEGTDEKINEALVQLKEAHEQLRHDPALKRVGEMLAKKVR